MKKKDLKHKKLATDKNDKKPKIISCNSTNTKKQKSIYPKDIQKLFERLGLD